jgi:small-conductance mechanosensitive channel
MRIFLYQVSGRNFEVGIIWESIGNLWESFLSQIPYLVIGLAVFVVFLVVSRIVSGAVQLAGERTRLDLTLARLLGRLASFVITIVGILVTAVIVFPTFSPGDLVTGLGITSVAIGFAFKDVLQNFFAGILILWRRPFVVGDQISFDEFDGTVEEINVRSTRIRTYDGERAVIPNGIIYTNAVLVRTAYPERRTSLMVGIGYQDSIESAKEIILRMLERTEGILAQPESTVRVLKLAPSSVDLQVQFWTNSHQSEVNQTADRVMSGIKVALDSAGIEMPYPHSVVLLQRASGAAELVQKPPH